VLLLLHAHKSRRVSRCFLIGSVSLSGFEDALRIALSLYPILIAKSFWFHPKASHTWLMRFSFFSPLGMAVKLPPH
jgi:hypothetical protein